MNNSELKVCLNDNIRGYKLQRKNDILTKYDLHNNLYTYSCFVSNFGALNNDSVCKTIMLGGVIIGSIKLLSSYKSHDLTDEIKYLQKIKEDLSLGYNYYENTSREEFEKSLAKKRAFLK